MIRFVLHWVARDVSGNPEINPTAKDRKVVPSYGFTPVFADTPEQARANWLAVFPETSVTSVTAA